MRRMFYYTQDKNYGRGLPEFTYACHSYRDGVQVDYREVSVYTESRQDFLELLDLWNRHGNGPANKSNMRYVYYSLTTKKGD